MRAVAINPFDTKVRRGVMGGDLPKGTGMDVAGVADDGTAVFGAAAGPGAAEYAVLAHWATKPDSLSFEEAAGYVTACETAVRCLDLIDVGDGDTVVIVGASGGVGSAAVQFAVARGARVIGTASAGNHDYLRELGAEPTTHDLADRRPRGRRHRHRRPGRRRQARRTDRRPGARRHDRRLRRQGRST